jgi:hypothetical protein
LIVRAEAEAKEDPAEKDVSALQVVLETDFRSIYQDLSPEDKQRFWRSIIDHINMDMDGNIISVDFFYGNQLS